MSADVEYRNRQLVPRFFPSAASAALTLGNRTPETMAISDWEAHNCATLVADWHRDKSVLVALDLLSYALLFRNIDDELVGDLTQYLNGKRAELPPPAAELVQLAAARYGHKSASIPKSACLPADYAELIRAARLKARDYQLNPINWVDMAYYYTVLGFAEKAKRSMTVALAANSENRYILRSAARFYLHAGDPAQALYALRSARSLRSDPWLIASEIAISEVSGKSSEMLKRAMLLATDEQLHPGNRAELLAQLATLEFYHGKASKARTLLRSALVCPNENVLAQTEFLSREFDTNRGEGYIPQLTDVRCTFEAQTWQNYWSGRFGEAIGSAKDWFSFQPFSSRPAIVASYLACVALDDDSESIRILETALVSSPSEFTLLNNLAVSHAKMGHIADAKRVLSLMDPSQLGEDDKAVHSATIGFVDVLSGNTPQGKSYYDKAIARFNRTRNERALARLHFFYGLALRRAGDGTYETHWFKARELATKLDLRELTVR